MPQSIHASNLLLASLGAAELSALAPHLKSVELPQEKVLFEAGDAIKLAYFPHSGIISLVVDLASGEMIEAAMVGRDSVVGGAAAFCSKTALNRAVVQLAGTASVMAIDQLGLLAERNTEFRGKLMRHEQFLMAQAQQSAACNATHSLEARMARWLLRCRDLAGRDDIALTQEYLAQMLGVRRTSVSIVAHTLQEAGLLRYRRGHIRLLDVDGLRESACECYETVKSRSGQLLGQTLPTPPT
jgi:CRP-like cAMP-binding protein